MGRMWTVEVYSRMTMHTVDRTTDLAGDFTHIRIP